MEDIGLRGQGRLLLIQVKTKEAEGSHWTPSEPLLVKALYRFYSNPALDQVDPPVRFVFLSNRGFNPDLTRLKRSIAKGEAARTSQADTLFRYLEEYAAGNGSRKRGVCAALDRDRFNRMLARLALIEFLALDVLPLTLRTVAEANGIDGEDTYRRLYTNISGLSVQQGGARLILDDLYRIVPDLFAGRIVDYIRSQRERAIADYLLAVASAQPLPPLGTTVTGVVTKLDRLIHGHSSTLLTSVEAFVLLIATCSPYLLERFAGVLPVNGSNRTSQLAAVLAKTSEAPLDAAQVLRDFTNLIESVRQSGAAFAPEAPGYADQYIRGERVRIQLLGALLYLAVLVDLDQHVDPTPQAAIAQGDWSSKHMWWRQAYVQSVAIENHNVRLSITLPADRHDEYRPWLVDALDKELQRQITLYSTAILGPEGIPLTYQPAIVHRESMPHIDEDDWQRLRRELRLEQARATADQHDQQILDAQQLRDLLVYDRARQAEQYAQEKQFAEAAQLYVEVAQRLARAGAYVQARFYARCAASAFAEVDPQAEAEQYLFAVEVWLQNSLSPGAAQGDLSSAANLATRLGLPELRLRVLSAQALFNFTILHDQEVILAFQEARSLLPRVHDEARRSALTYALTMREAMFAVVQEQWDTARALLELELVTAEQRSIEEQVEFLGLLLLVAAETGDWELADELYHRWGQRLPHTHPDHDGLIAMHYAASLARRSDLQDASAVYNHAIAQLDGNADLAHIGLAYQNKQYMLGRHGPLISSDFSQQEARRIDLFNSRTHNDTRGYSHEGEALREFVAGNLDNVARHVRLAKLFYRRDGDWLGLEHIYRLEARWHEHEGDSVSALLAVVRACDRKAVEQHCQALRDAASPSALNQAVEVLLEPQPAVAQEVVAAQALGALADVIPPAALTRVIERLVYLLRGPETTLQHRHARSHASGSLRQLVSQMDEAQANKTVRLALEQLAREQGWEVTKELILLLTTVLSHSRFQLTEDLLTSIVDRGLAFGSADIFRSEVDNLIFVIMPRLSAQLRQRAAGYLQEHPNHLDSTGIRALVGEPPSEHEIVEMVEQILAAIDPPRGDTDEARGFPIYFGGVNARQLLNYSDLLPVSLHERIIDGLVNAISSGRGERLDQVEAIRAISKLPEAVTRNRADEIIACLLQAEAGQIARTGLSLGFGSVEDVKQASLRALGQLYRFARQDNQVHIQQRLIAGARNTSSEVRCGAAMACAALDGDVQPQDLLLAIFVLLHDTNPEVVARSCIAAGHFVARGAAGGLLHPYINRLISLTHEAQVVEVRIGAARALRLISDGSQLDEAIRKQVAENLADLANDTSARVRQEVGMAARTTSAAS